jgi:hypothetical protein
MTGLFRTIALDENVMLVDLPVGECMAGLPYQFHIAMQHKWS